jgi:outer membrane receptor protein involved in Fe transport
MQLAPMQYRKLLIVLTCALAAQFAVAQEVNLSEFSLEQLLDVKVISAAKYEQSTRDAPSAVQIITREEIRRHGWRTLSEALLTLPGQYISNDRAYDFLGARGFLIAGDYNTRFLLLIDGQRNNDNIYQQAGFGTEGWLDMSSVERIEYIPGPGSAIYGANAMFGVINVITRTADTLPFRQISATHSKEGLTAGNLIASQTLGAEKESKGTQIFMQYSRDFQAGRDRQYNDPLGNLQRADASPASDAVAHGLDTGRNQHFFLRVDHDEWSIKLINHARAITPSSALYLSVFDDPALNVSDGGTQVNVALQQRLSTESSVYARLGYTDWHYRGIYAYLDPGLGYYQNLDDVRGKILDGELRYLRQINAHHLLTGLEFSSDLLRRQRNYFSVDPALLGTSDIDINTPANRTGLFLEDNWRLNKSWLLSLGVRADRESAQHKAIFSPRAGVIWYIADRWTGKLLNGRAYRSANAYESQFGNGLVYLNNNSLRAETIETNEGVLEWQHSHDTRAQLSLFHNKLNNLIQQLDTGGGILQYQNNGNTEVRGVEIGFDKKTADSLKLRASIAFNQAKSSSKGTVDNSPDWIGKTSLSLPVFNSAAIFAGELQLINRRSFLWGGAPYSVPLEANSSTTLTFHDVLFKGMQMQLRISNLLNRSLAHPASTEASTPTIPQNGRNFIATVAYEY